jgi:ketosteroid isomerase-like protein
MWRLVLVSALGLVTVATPKAQTPEQDITRVEQVRLEARRKADSSTLAKLATDDQLTVGPNGQLQDKKATAALDAAPKASLRETKTQVFGDVAVVTGTQAGFGDKGDIEQRFTRIWLKQNGQWLNVFGHVTRVNAAAAPAPQPQLKSVPQTVWPKGNGPEETAVIDTLRRLDEAFAKKDPATYAQLTAANYLRVGANGGLSDRDAYVKNVAGTPETKRDIPNLSEFRVRMYGPVALITWVNKSIGGSEAGLRRSRVFVKEGGTWKQLIGQDTPIQPTK